MRGFTGFVLGVVLTLAALWCGGWLYLHYGHPPVAVADHAFPMEAKIVHMPLHARIAREMEQPPFGANEQVYEAGAQIYAQRCAVCHGVPGQEAALAQWMYPRAPQLWKRHGRHHVIGVSDDPAGETYWKVKNGIRLSGMPSFEHLLSDEQMWDVSLLLKAADQPLSPQVHSALAAQ